ncbi:uncharacterized protein LOC129585525 [Paramacrobiotus metropolitanus]|uniref:uncharacterized protein LOC129585525 n=1 Tax=Paramacrobiotus metropolitanus TaxID=2943436 RepID=UPI0024456772|nr:uncharacterized protein LOC129585525 [Paramacrobiotus metropolitanus]
MDDCSDGEQPLRKKPKHEEKEFASSYSLLYELGLTSESTKQLTESDHHGQKYAFTYGHANELLRFFKGQWAIVATILTKFGALVTSLRAFDVDQKLRQVIREIRKKTRVSGEAAHVQRQKSFKGFQRIAPWCSGTAYADLTT